MENYSGPYIQLFFSQTPNSDKRLRVHRKKIIPQMEYFNKVIEQHENEWQQEYYIIYNSYVLDENNPEN